MLNLNNIGVDLFFCNCLESGERTLVALAYFLATPGTPKILDIISQITISCTLQSLLDGCRKYRDKRLEVCRINTTDFSTF